MLQPLSENIYCASLSPLQKPTTETDDNGNLKFDLFCNGTIYGRYLTVQRMGCGTFGLNEITFFPAPS